MKIMTEPIKKKSPEKSEPSPTQPTKGNLKTYTITWNPKIRNTSRIGKLYATWQSFFSGSIAAQFGVIPTSFEGIKKDFITLKEKQKTLPQAHFHRHPQEPGKK